jgi:hypothetical protein
MGKFDSLARALEEMRRLNAEVAKLQAQVVGMSDATHAWEAEVARLRGERDEAREAAKWLYANMKNNMLPKPDVYPWIADAAYKKHPWLEDER